MRTEDDLRTALTALERHAPAAARVLPGSSRQAKRGLRSPQTARWLAGIATAAALVGVVTALTLPGGTPRTVPNGGVASSAPITKATVQAKILAAMSAADNEIAYMHETSTAAGSSLITEESWYYQWQASAGQQVRSRDLTFNTAGTLRIDTGDSYLMTQSGKDVEFKGEEISVDYAAKTWYDNKHFQATSNVSLNPRDIVLYLLNSGYWTVHKTALDGRAALELSLKSVSTRNWTANFWIDASTYLPLREVTSLVKSGRTIATEDYQYLPATPVNLAKLTPPVPAGFKLIP